MRYQANDGTIRDDYPHKFGPDDFAQLERFLDGRETVPLCEMAHPAYPEHLARFVGMRHDVDHNLEHALKFARLENQAGHRATYFVLHSAWYWQPGNPEFDDAIHELVELGHEVGIHSNAVALARDDGPDPGHARAARILNQALLELRALVDGHAGNRLTTLVVGAAAHGDIRCTTHNCHNNDLWEEQGGEWRLEQFQLRYEAYFLHRDKLYISDSGGKWSDPLEHSLEKQTTMLIHPCHWDLDAL